MTKTWKQIGESPAYWGGLRSEWTLAKQRQLHEMWKKVHARAILDDYDFFGEDLCGAHLGFLSLERANFNGAKLQYTNFGASLLYQATFVGADLRYADLIDAELIGADFAEANLTGARMPDGSIHT